MFLQTPLSPHMLLLWENSSGESQSQPYLNCSFSYKHREHIYKIFTCKTEQVLLRKLSSIVKYDKLVHRNE